MRIIFILICFTFFWPEAYPQVSGYTFTPEGSLIFTEVIESEGYNQNELFEHAVKAFSAQKQKKSKLNKDKEDKTLTKSKSFSLYEKGLLSRIPTAEIQFDLFMEFKDKRYRYQFKDFYYLPYERNRYGKYEVVQRKRKSLEDLMQKKQEWSKIEEEFNTQIQAEIEQMKQTMSSQMSQQKTDSVSNIIQLDKEW